MTSSRPPLSPGGSPKPNRSLTSRAWRPRVTMASGVTMIALTCLAFLVGSSLADPITRVSFPCRVSTGDVTSSLDGGGGEGDLHMGVVLLVFSAFYLILSLWLHFFLILYVCIYFFLFFIFVLILYFT